MEILRNLTRMPLIILGAFFLLVSAPVYSFNDRYDDSFRKWTAYYMPEVPWYWLKAQAYIESGLDPNAVSPVGAKGLTQFMDYTWKDMEERLGFKGSPFNPDLSIQSQAAYMKQLRSNWTRHNRNSCQIQDLALASYNAGIGNILESQKKSGGQVLWGDIKKYLPEVTGHHSKETVGYVDRFWRTVKRMVTP